jgi:hypothetical protein
MYAMLVGRRRRVIFFDVIREGFVDFIRIRD